MHQSNSLLLSLHRQTQRSKNMTKQEFNQRLEELNTKLMNSKTREEHSIADHEINMLVDEFRKPKKDKDLQEANAIALHLAG